MKPDFRKQSYFALRSIRARFNCSSHVHYVRYAFLATPIYFGKQLYTEMYGEVNYLYNKRRIRHSLNWHGFNTGRKRVDASPYIP